MESTGFGFKVLIGFATAIVALFGLYIGIEIIEKDYEDFDHISSYQRILDQEEDMYFVYWYGPDCLHCKAIKDQVINFARKSDVKVYMIDSSVATGTPNLVHPTDSTIAMSGTPTLILVKDGKVADMIVGGEDIPSIIKVIEAGEYDLIN